MHDFKGWGRRNKKNLIGYRLNINGDLVDVTYIKFKYRNKVRIENT